MVSDGEPSADSKEGEQKYIQELKKEIKMLYDEISRLQEGNRKLKEELKSVKFDEQFLEHGNTTKKTKFFIGFPDYATFIWVLNFCLSVLPCSTVLSKGSIFLFNFHETEVCPP